MTKHTFYQELGTKLAQLRTQGLYKSEQILHGPQGAELTTMHGAEDQTTLNFCSNNYLGLANHPRLLAVAKEAVDRYGFGMASVRFICGTQDIHRDLEREISAFLGTEQTTLYSSCFDANGGLFETVLGEKDAIISDALNHASIIDGIRLCRARRYRYANNDMQDLKRQLQTARDHGAQHIMIATDGVFSMDGVIANLPAICDLADEYQALVMVDDSHAVGVLGACGSGTAQYHGVQERIDIVTGTLGKALGGASGGYTSGRAELIDWLRQRSRPYLFSNALAPSIVEASREALRLLKQAPELRQKLHENAALFRHLMQDAGFTLAGAHHPIIPIMIGDAQLANTMAAQLRKAGIYVVAFSYPVVPEGSARIRVQISSAHTEAHIRRAVATFTKVAQALHIL